MATQGLLIYGSFGEPNDCDNCVLFGHCSIDYCKASILDVVDMDDAESARGMNGFVSFTK